MIRKIPEIISELIHYLFCKVHKLENQLMITINDTITTNNHNNNCNNNDSNNNNNDSNNNINKNKLL